MDRVSAEKRIKELSEVLEEHSYKYYVLDNPDIDDYDFDMMMNELKELEAQFPELVLPSSPTQRVGGMALNTFEKVQHTVQMASLQDVFDFEQVKNFLDKCNTELVSPEYTAEPKIDG